MDYYQSVVVEYLRATRTRFVNTECLIQLVPGDIPDKGLHWYCDALVIDLQVDPQNPLPSVYLCEISYSKTLAALFKRLDAWRQHWRDIKEALVQDCAVDRLWQVSPWLFIPEERTGLVNKKFPVKTSDPEKMPRPRVTTLEEIAPWKYRGWNGKPYAAAVQQSAIRNE
jgi:hypothetical protein